LAKLQDSIRLVKQTLNPNLKIEGILLSMYDSRLRLSNVLVSEVRDIFKELVFETIIHRNSRIGEAPSMHTPVVMFDANSRGSVNFLNLAKEFLEKNGDSIETPALVTK